MAEYGRVDASIPLSVRKPDMMGKLSELLNMQQQSLAIQGQRSANISAAAQASNQQQDLQERQAATDILKNQEKYGLVDANGITDLTKLIPAILQAAPKTGGAFIEPVMQGYLAQLSVSQAAQNLSRSVREDVNSALAAVTANPSASYGDVVMTADLIKKQNPNSAKTVDALLSYLSPKEPMEVTRQKLKTFARTVLPPTELVGTGGLVTPQATVIDSGAAVVPGAIDRQTGAFTAAGPAIPKEIPPGFSVVVDPRTSNPYLLNQQTGEMRDMGHGYPGKQPGRGSAAGGPSAGGPPSGRPGSMPEPFYPGQAQDIAVQQEEVANVRASADQAPLNRSIYQHILHLGEDTKTGPAMAFLQKNPIIAQMFGDNYQELGKYLEKNAIANMTAMGGPPSDARLAAAVAANGSTTFNPQALQAVTRFNYATNTALEKFRQGLDQAVGTKNPNYAALPQFKADWAANFDIAVFLLENAINDGNDKLKSQILNSLTEQQAAAMMKKRKNLDALSRTGKLPQ